VERAGKTSVFSGNITVREPGDYTIDVFAYDPANRNTGLIRCR
jgi:hypothetical protein